MTPKRATVAVLIAALTSTTAVTAASPANAASTVSRRLFPVTCSTHPYAVHINVPYVPYTYCYEGVGVRRGEDITQVYSVDAGGWSVTLVWRPPGGSWRQSNIGGMDGRTIYLHGGTIDTISIP